MLVGHYVLEPARHRRWLRRDIPHLPVVFSDGEIRVGPLVEPGHGPCLYCLELARVDEDPAWPAIACQLVGRDAPTETARASIDVATHVAGLVQAAAGWARAGRLVQDRRAAVERWSAAILRDHARLRRPDG